MLAVRATQTAAVTVEFVSPESRHPPAPRPVQHPANFPPPHPPSPPPRMILTGRKIVTKVGILLPAGRRDASRRRVRQTYLTQSGRSAPPVTPGEAGWECSPSCQCGSWGNTPSDCKKTGWVMGNGVPRRNFTFWLLKLSLASRSNADECCGN